MAEHCGSCVWRSGRAGYKCDYAGKTDRTRKAESPDGCTYYLRGDIVTDDRTAQRLYRKVMAKRKAAGAGVSRPAPPSFESGCPMTGRRL